MSRLRSPASRLSSLFSQEGFRGPVLTLMSGSAIALAASYVAQPILTRLYDPGAFGVADYFVGLMTIIFSAASLRYEDALMIPERDEDAAQVLWLSAALTVITAMVLALAIPFAEPIAGAIGVPAIAPWIPLIPAALLLMRFAKLSELWLARLKQYRSITVGDTSNKLSMLGTRLGAGAVPGVGAGGLIGGFMAGHFVASAIYLRLLIRKKLLPGPRSAGEFASLARRFQRFPLFTMPSSVMTAVVARLPILLLPVFFPIEVVGLYGRAFVVLAIPLGVLGDAVTQVFFVRAAEARSDGTLGTLTRDVHARLVLIGAYPTAILIAAGPELFEFVLGDAWRPAGEYVRYVALWLFLGSVTAPLTRLFDILERQRADFLSSLTMLIGLTLALIIGGSSGSVERTLLAVGIVGTLVRIIQLLAATYGAGVDVRGMIRPYVRYFAFSLPGVVLTAMVVARGTPFLATVAAVAGAAVYALVVARDEGLLARSK